MKNNRINIKATFFILFLGVMTIYACKEDEEVYEKTRLFRPVLNEDLFSEGNTIIVNLGKMKEALSYTLEVSRDSFKTVEFVIDTDTNYVEINESLVGEELFWNTLYQVRATAHASNPEFDSKVSDLGSVRTQRFPTILNLPAVYDVTDVAARVTWTLAGAPVTSTRVFAPDDLQLENPLFEEQVVSEEGQALGETIVTGLSPSTEYQIAIYSGEELRGWVPYVTREPLPSGDNVIDLTGIEDPMILAETLPTVPNGSIILLERGRVYDMSEPPVLENSFQVRSGYGFSPSLPVIEFGLHKGFNIGDASIVDSLVFKEVALKGPFEGSFLFYLNSSGSINEIKFDGCEIGPLRGGLRINNGTGTLDKITFVNSVVDSLESYNLIYLQGADWTVGDIHISNSTFSRIGSSFIRSNNVNDTRSIIIESSTFNQIAHTGRNIFDWGKDDVNVTNGIILRDNIWGHGWDNSGGESYGIGGYSRLENTTFEIINNWGTSDLDINANEIPGFPNSVYSGKATDLWEDPDNLNFNFKDTGFQGRSNAGDPRWRIVL